MQPAHEGETDSGFKEAARSLLGHIQLLEADRKVLERCIQLPIADRAFVLPAPQLNVIRTLLPLNHDHTAFLSLRFRKTRLQIRTELEQCVQVQRRGVLVWGR